uniref:Uracil phosphoribosyltransferase n=1 Tax=Ceramothamnion japonicum TaxID=218448 RepID=A0A1C9CDE2_CERJP|nr:uracil phosphoribosyltransferase [Ceramium japonicum]AOM66413.1 uracil phosphoribosyltransferase [Ceramium japonicum]
MKLNIYIISHPIIKIFSHNIKKNHLKSESTQDDSESKIMLFIIYEILRKLIYITNIYINKLDYIKHISVMDYQQKNYIITNMVKNFHLLTEIYNKFPHTYITNCNNNENYTNQIHQYDINDKTNILIVENFLTEDTIIKTIQNIQHDMKIKEKQITIACITCTNQILEKISQYYNEINLYTTKIIYN